MTILSPKSIRLTRELNISEAISEFEYAKHIDELADKNKLYKTYIGKGYYNTIVPAPIKRNILENPGWYTAYTPYQAEISQGRLEALLNFQTMVIDLTGMEIANASLLDEGTAAAEAMIMFYNTRSRAAQKAGVMKFFIDKNVFAHTIDVMTTRAIPLGIELVIEDFKSIELDETYFGALVQYPASNGEVNDYEDFTAKAHDLDIKVAAATDLMALALLKSPGEWDADCVVGNSQRFGVPMGFGGPHAAFFATRESYKRSLPGRIIGISVDKDGNPALRMALQTREQHIKRDKATSNICTAQALLAVMAGFYAVYHGPTGIKAIASEIHANAAALAQRLEEAGLTRKNKSFFDTITYNADEELLNKIKNISDQYKINLFIGNGEFGISIDETTSKEDLNNIIIVLAEATGLSLKAINNK